MKNSPFLRYNRSFLLYFARPYRFEFIAGAIFILVSVVAGALPVRLVQSFIDTLKDGRLTEPFILRVTGGILLLVLANGILLFFQRKWITASSRAIEYDVRKLLFGFLHQQPASFFVKNKTGHIMSRLTNDLGQVREMIGAGFLHLGRTVLNAAVILAMMLSISPRYTLIPLVPVVLLPFLSTALMSRLGRMYAAIQEKLSAMNSVVQESFAGTGVVRAYGREGWRSAKFRKSNDDYFRANMTLARFMGTMWPLFGFIAALAQVILLYAGGRGVIRGEISLGALTALNLYLLMLTWPLIGFGWVISMIQRGSASLRRLREFIETDESADETGGLAFAGGDIVIRDLSFTYPGSVTPALDGVSMRIPRGSRVAVVGTVGSGKSTVAAVLSRICDPPAGAVTVGGTDILEFSRRSFREAVGMVPQETVLFSDTLKNNVEFGKKSAPGELERAMDISQLEKDLKELPGGLAQVVGERGINLSGGQKQRVAIARAVLRDPEFLILDDCLSSVDADTEAEILSRLEAFFKGRTVVVISHRVSVIRGSDHIYVMDNGRVAEEGSHEKLMAAQGLYARLYERQSMEEGL